MGTDWQLAKIGDLGRVITGRTPPGNDEAYYGGEVLFLTPSDMVGHRYVEKTGRTLSPFGAEKLARCLIPNGVGVSCIGWQMGKAVLITKPTVTNQQINSVVVDERIAHTKFVYYALSARRDEIFNLGAGGSRTPILNKGDFERLPFCLPSLPEQRSIASVLGSLDDKIELNGRMNETLEGIARALFKSWFVDFDPVRAKAEGRSTGLPDSLAAIFPGSFEPTENGDIPQGWQLKPIGNLATVSGGSTPSTKEPSYWEGDHYWATPKDLSTLRTPVLLETERKISDAGVAQISSGLLPKGTVLMSSRAPIGYLAITEVPVAINQGFIALQPAAGVSNLFLLRWAEWAHDIIVRRANGSTFLEISKSNFRPILVVTPPESLMKEFDRIAGPLYQRLVLNEQTSKTLIRLRDGFLPKLISGELRVFKGALIAPGQIVLPAEETSPLTWHWRATSENDSHRHGSQLNLAC